MMEEEPISADIENERGNNTKHKLSLGAYIAAVFFLASLVTILFLPIGGMSVFSWLLAGIVLGGVLASLENQSREGIKESLYGIGILLLLSTLMLFVFTNAPVLGLLGLAGLAFVAGFCIQHYSAILAIITKVLAHDFTKLVVGPPLVLCSILFLAALVTSGPITPAPFLLAIGFIISPLIFAGIVAVAETWVARNNAEGWNKSSLHFSVVKGLRYCLSIVTENDTSRTTAETMPSTYCRDFVDFRPCASQPYQDQQSGVWYYFAPIIMSAPNTAAGYEADDDSNGETATSETTPQ